LCCKQGSHGRIQIGPTSRNSRLWKLQCSYTLVKVIQMRLFTWHRYLLLAWDSVHCFKFLTSLLGWSVGVYDSLPPIKAGFVAMLGHHKTTTLVSPHMPLSSTEVFWVLFRSLQFEVSNDSKIHLRRRYWFTTIHVALEGL
jgi:hypothetical protein